MKIRLYVYSRTDAGGNRYDTGRFDTEAPAGSGCLDPDPQAFDSLQALIEYARSKGESLQQTTIEGVNAICGYGYLSGLAGGAAGSSNVCDCCSEPCGCSASASPSTTGAAAASSPALDSSGGNMDWESFIQSLTTGTAQIIGAARAPTTTTMYPPYNVNPGASAGVTVGGNSMGLLVLVVIAVLILKG